MIDLLKRIQGKVNRWRQFSWRERGLFLQAWFLLPPMVLGLQLSGFQKFQQFLQNRIHGGTEQDQYSKKNDDDVLVECFTISKMIKVAARYSLITPKCLPKSLLLWWLLGREGITSDLRLGAQKDNKQFEAHAWVEYKGIVINDSQLVKERYTTFNSSETDLGHIL